LAARANFFLAGLAQSKDTGTDYWDNKAYKRLYDIPEKFRPYYQALNNYRDTAFVKAMNFNCPTAKNFLDSAKPMPNKRKAHARPGKNL
jgi:hypothetical protein